MLALISLYRASFEYLLEQFKKAYDIPWRLGKRGRPVKFPLHHYALGAILVFYSSQAELKLICTTFGAGPAVMSRTLQKAEHALFAVTRKIKDSSAPQKSHLTRNDSATVCTMFILIQSISHKS